jgi:hypothetical protein
MARATPQNPPLSTAGASMARQKTSEWEQLLRRYPLASSWGLAFQIASTLFGNALVVWLVASGRMSPFELVLLVAIEATLLIGLAWLQTRGLPPDALEPNKVSLRQRLGAFGFMLVWLSGVYGIALIVMVPSWPEMAAAARDPLEFLAASSLRWPLAITLLTAGIDALHDAAHFRRHGGKFLSTPGFQGAARLLTLILGGIPFVVPFFALVIAVKLAVERIHAKLTKGHSLDGRRSLLVVGGLVLGVWALYFGVVLGIDQLDRVLQSGVAWWALCYGAAKFVSELFIVSLPLIATKAQAEDEEKAAAVVAKPKAAKRRR